MFSLKNNHKIRRQGFHKKRFIYSKKSYSNPFFRHNRTTVPRFSGHLSNKIKLIVLASAVAALILIWLLFFSSLFKITIIDVSGAGENTIKDAKAVAWGVAGNRLLAKNNLLLYNKDELAKVLNDKYYLQSLNIEKKLPHTLIITLEEKQQAAVWHEDDKYFYLDGDGNVINQVDPLNVNRQSLPVIENSTDVKIDGRKANIDQTSLDYAISLFNEFKDKKHGFEIEKFILDKDINTVKMAVLDGPKIFFNTKEAVAVEAARLDLLIKEKLKDSFSQKEYINLRFGDNVYIKDLTH